MRLRELGEYALIEALTKTLKDVYPENPLPPGDDAAAVRIGNYWAVLKIDGTDSHSSRYPWLTLGDLAYRVALGTVTDVISKGAKPIALTLSLGIPKDYEEEVVYEIIDGVKELVKSINAYYLGGDINSSINDYVWLDVAGMGLAKKLIPNNTFMDGDTVYITGCIGLSSIEALTYYRKLDVGVVKEYLEVRRRPKPPIDFLKLASKVKASTDISDGLYSITKVIRRLGLDLILNEDLPICDEVFEFMRRFGIDLNDVLRYLGEEYTIVFSFEGKLSGYPVLGTLRKGKGRVFYGGKQLVGGWDNFRGFIG